MSSETKTVIIGIISVVMACVSSYGVFYFYKEEVSSVKEEFSLLKEENSNLKLELASRSIQSSDNVLELANKNISNISNKIQSGNISCSDIDSLKSEISSIKNEVLSKVNSTELDFALVQNFGEKIKYLNKLLSRFYIEKCS